MLDMWRKHQLIEKLEKCQVIRDRAQRDQIVGELPLEWSANLKRSDAMRSDILNIVNEVNQHDNGIEFLIECVRFLEVDSPAIQDVEIFWAELVKSGYPIEIVMGPKKDAITTDPDVRLAQERHWDCEKIVEIFVGMIKSDPKYAPWRILALEGPEKAGLKNLVERLAYIAEQLSQRARLERPMLHARVEFQPWMSSAPHLVVKEIVTSLATKADLTITQMDASPLHTTPHVQTIYADVSRVFDQMGDRVDVTWGESATGRMPQSKTALARDLTTCLSQASQHCAIVLFFEDFEQLDFASRRWFLDDWLGRNIVRLDNVGIVIVGESGLSYIEGRDDFTCFRHPSEMSPTHFLAWAQEGWRLVEITQQQIHDAYKNTGGNPVKFLHWLRAWASAYNVEPPDSCKQRPI